MKKISSLVYFSIVFLMATSVFCLAKDTILDEAVQEIQADVVDGGPVFFNADAEDKENVEATQPVEDDTQLITDERIRAIESGAQAEILAVVAEINQLEDKSTEPELQKEIERIKLDAEIARLRIHMQDAEAEENFELADEFNDHIDYLENLNEPVVGIPGQQPNP